MGPRLRSRFVKEVIDALERSDASLAMRLSARLIPRLLRSLSDQVYNDPDPRSSMPLADAEELLLGIDAALGDGSGRVLESAGFVLGSRLLSHRSSALVPGDLARTLARMRTPIELPYEGVQIVFDVVDTEVGLELALGVLGSPRCTRVLRHLTVGYIKAAYTFGLNRNPEEIRIYADVIGDRASISCRYKRASMAPPANPADAQRGPKRSTSRARIPAVGSLSAEVDRIFERTTLPPTGRVGVGRSSSSFRAVRDTLPPPPELPGSYGARAGERRDSSSPPPPRSQAAHPGSGRPASEIRQRVDRERTRGGGGGARDQRLERQSMDQRLERQSMLPPPVPASGSPESGSPAEGLPRRERPVSGAYGSVERPSDQDRLDRFPDPRISRDRRVEDPYGNTVRPSRPPSDPARASDYRLQRPAERPNSGTYATRGEGDRHTPSNPNRDDGMLPASRRRR